MGYQADTVWTVIKQFITGWLIAGVFLVVISCVKYHDFIVTAFANHTWAWINAVMPLVIIVLVIGYLIRSIFR